MWKDIAHKESKTNVVRNGATVSTRNRSPNFAERSGKSNDCEWHIDVAVAKKCPAIPRYLHNDESESSSACKIQETITADVISIQNRGNDYDTSDDKQEYSSASNYVSDNYANKIMSAFHYNSGRGDIMKSTRTDKMFAVGNNDNETGKKSYKSKLEDRRSLDTTITEVEECHSVHCSQTENEISSIQKQLLEIEKKQSRLMDLFQVIVRCTIYLHL